MYKKSDLFYTVLHLPVDIAALVLAFVVSYNIRAEGSEIYLLPFQDYFSLLWRVIPLWIIVFALQGLYTRRYLFSSLQNLLHTIVSVLAGWAAFVVFLSFLKTEQTIAFPRLLLIYILISSIVFIFGGRLFLRLIQSILRIFGIGRKRLVIMGKGKAADQMESTLTLNPDPAYNFVMSIESTEPKDVANLLKKERINTLVIADHSLSDNQILEYLTAAQNEGIEVNLVPNMFEVQASNVLFNTLGGLPLLTFRQTPLDGWGRITKRTFDIFLALIGGIILLPLILLTAFIVKITSSGPIVFRQRRLGRNGKHFYIYKFRSMYLHLTGDHVKGKTEEQIFADMGRQDLVEEYRTFKKVKVDPRVTPFGRLMRKTRLDELPQLWNVLKGDLSIVGPRPIRDFELSQYGKWASYLLSIKPGLTGLWQVSGGNDISYEERVKLDAKYAQNWSLWQDMLIILKTGFIILKGGDGY
ncbi:MAG TPA: sugar transferase [Patescibacteria group bacterium]